MLERESQAFIQIRHLYITRHALFKAMMLYLKITKRFTDCHQSGLRKNKCCIIHNLFLYKLTKTLTHSCSSRPTIWEQTSCFTNLIISYKTDYHFIVLIFFCKIISLKHFLNEIACRVCLIDYTNKSHILC